MLIRLKYMLLGFLVIVLFYPTIGYSLTHKDDFQPLGGPYWVSTAKLAMGYLDASNNNTYKYLIGTDGTQKKIFSLRPDETQWGHSVTDNSIGLVNSYHFSNSGRAFYYSVGGRIQTTTIGYGWLQYGTGLPSNSNYTAALLDDYNPSVVRHKCLDI